MKLIQGAPATRCFTAVVICNYRGNNTLISIIDLLNDLRFDDHRISIEERDLKKAKFTQSV